MFSTTRQEGRFNELRWGWFVCCDPALSLNTEAVNYIVGKTLAQMKVGILFYVVLACRKPQ